MSAMMSLQRLARALGHWLAALTLALVLFYALDQGVMAMQGLPLNWNLTPAQ